MIYLEDGRIAAQGSYEQVRENERFVSLLQEFNSGGLAGTSDDDADSIQVLVLKGCPSYLPWNHFDILSAAMAFYE